MISTQFQEGSFMNYIKGLLLSILLISVPAFAEVETTSSIRGTVNVAGATVENTNQSTGQTKSVTAGTTGNFSASFLKVSRKLLSLTSLIIFFEYIND